MLTTPHFWIFYPKLDELWCFLYGGGSKHHCQPSVGRRHSSLWVFWENLSTTISSSLTTLFTWREISTNLWSSLSVQLHSLVCCPTNSSHLGLSRFLVLVPQLGGSLALPIPMLQTEISCKAETLDLIWFTPCLSGIPAFCCLIPVCWKPLFCVYFFCCICLWFQVVV